MRKKWWQVGLSREQVLALKAEAEMLCRVNGPAARKAVLDRARSFGRRHWREAMRLSRLAACIADQMKESTH